MRLKDEKDQEYYDYIKEHISNVQKAFAVLGKSLCSKAHVPISVVSDLVAEHDQSKYSDEEFPGYRQWFYPKKNETKSREIFDEAWKHHYTVNKHHPEHWVKKDGTARPMPDMYVVEMILDWSAMCFKFGGDPESWYYEEKERAGKLNLNPTTRQLVESLLPVISHNEVFKQ